MPLKTSFFPSLTDEPICQPNCVFIKTLHVKLFLIRKHVCGGGGGGGGGWFAPEPRKIGGCPMSGTHKAGKCPMGEPGGGGGMGTVGIDGA